MKKSNTFSTLIVMVEIIIFAQANASFDGADESFEEFAEHLADFTPQ